MKEEFKIILFYKFTAIENPAVEAEKQREKCAELSLKGRMILAEEGVNATFEGTAENIETYKQFIRSDPRFKDMLIKESVGTGFAFPKLSIKVRDEIVTLGAGKFDVEKETAQQLPAEDLQKWYENDEDFYVLDLRNDYEVAVGKFDKTINPFLSNFRDINDKLEALKTLKKKKIVAVCTGGIRCEKATCLLKRAGFEDLYQLQDGIHTYIKEFPGEHFKGKLFVFDNRMASEIAPAQNSIIGTCEFCGTNAEKFYSDDSTRPSRKIIACTTCAEKESLHLRDSSLTVHM